MRMRIASLTFAVALIVPLVAAAADPPIVFQVQPVGKVLADVRTFTKLVGGEDALKQLNTKLKEKLGPKGLDGLDLERPIVGYVSLDSKLDEAVVVVAVPVTGEKEFLELLGRLEAPKPKMIEKGLYEFSGDKDGKVLMRFQAQHAYIAIGKAPAPALAAYAIVPAEKLFDPSEKGVAAGKVHFDRLPKDLRAQMAAGLRDLRSKLDALPIPPEAGEPARKAVDEFIKLGDRYLDLLVDAQTASARYLIDAASGEAAVEFGLTGAPGSKLADAIASRKPGSNNFAGLITPDTAAGIKLQLPLFAKEIQNAADIGLEAGQKQLGELAPRELKGLVEEVFKGLTRTVNTGEFDFVAGIRGPDKAGLYTVVGAVSFEDTSGLEKEVRSVVKTQAPPEVQEMVKFDVAKEGKTGIHQATVGAFLPPEAKKVFGENASLTFAFAPHGIFVAFGPDAVNTLKTALAVKKGPSSPFEIVVNPSRLRKLVETTGGSVAPAYGKEDMLLPAVSLSLEGGKELRLRVGMNLKAFAALGTQAVGEKSEKPSAAPVPMKK